MRPRSAGSMMVLAVCALGLVQGQAWAQPEGRGRGRGERMIFGGGPGGGGGGGMFTLPAFHRQQLERAAADLSLSEDQKTAAQALFEGYEEQTQRLEKQQRDAMESARMEFRESRDPSGFEGLREKMREARDQRKKLDGSLMEDVKALLSSEQTGRWESVERGMKREQSLRRGFVSGERADVVSLVRDLDLSEDTRKAISPVLSEYELSVDRELSSRDALLERAPDEMRKLREEGDTDGLEKLMKDGREAATRVRDVNRRFARQVEEAIPEERRAEFTEAFLRASYPQVYRETDLDRTLGAAKGLDDLTAEQRQALDTLAGKMTQERTAVNTKLRAAIDKAEAEFSLQNMRRGQGRDEGEVGDLRRQRRDAERKAMDELRKALTREQVERLPKDRDEVDERDIL